ncbi:hypothetical protein [Sphingomonas sp.]|uniref:hypothetical protein n=1 Tax=Sphingomonas sp. TaxID=28214 RepID=UPI0025EBC8D4|nr:hypothetical protein [Sphingomonas sp.]
MELRQHRRDPGFLRADPADAECVTFCVTFTGFCWINPDGCQRSSMKLCFETSLLLDASGRIQRRQLVPEEHSYWAPKRLIFPKYLWRESTCTNNSTNTSFGKG